MTVAPPRPEVTCLLQYASVCCKKRSITLESELQNVVTVLIKPLRSDVLNARDTIHGRHNGSGRQFSGKGALIQVLID